MYITLIIVFNNIILQGSLIYIIKTNLFSLKSRCMVLCTLTLDNVIIDRDILFFSGERSYSSVEDVTRSSCPNYNISQVISGVTAFLQHTLSIYPIKWRGSTQQPIRKEVKGFNGQDTKIKVCTIFKPAYPTILWCFPTDDHW